MNRRMNTSTYDKIDALSIIYLEQQDLSNMSPELLVDRFLETHEKIYNRFKELKKIDQIVNK